VERIEEEDPKEGLREDEEEPIDEEDPKEDLEDDPKEDPKEDPEEGAEFTKEENFEEEPEDLRVENRELVIERDEPKVRVTSWKRGRCGRMCRGECSVVASGNRV